jgi:hypothetical protein
MRTPVVYLISAAVIFGCSKKTETPTPPPTTEAAKPAPGETMKQDKSLDERLSDERKARDQGDPSTAKVVAALKVAGLTLSEEEPRLASPVGARTCVGFDTVEHLKLAICEYAIPEAATAGAAAVEKNFPSIANRTMHVKRSTTLMVLENPPDQTAADAHKKLTAAFDAL